MDGGRGLTRSLWWGWSDNWRGWPVVICFLRQWSSPGAQGLPCLIVEMGNDLRSETWSSTKWCKMPCSVISTQGTLYWSFIVQNWKFLNRRCSAAFSTTLFGLHHLPHEICITEHYYAYKSLNIYYLMTGWSGHLSSTALITYIAISASFRSWSVAPFLPLQVFSLGGTLLPTWIGIDAHLSCVLFLKWVQEGCNLLGLLLSIVTAVLLMAIPLALGVYILDYRDSSSDYVLCRYWPECIL